MGWYLYPLLRMHYAETSEVARLEKELDDLQDRNEQLRHDVERLQTPQGVEEAARESLGYVKPGENAYVVLAPDRSLLETADVVPDAEAYRESGSPPLWRRVLDFVFGVDT